MRFVSCVHQIVWGNSLKHQGKGGGGIFEEHACSEFSVSGCYFQKGQLLQYFEKGHFLNQRKTLGMSLGNFHSFWVWKSTLIYCLHLHTSVSARALKWESIFESVWYCSRCRQDHVLMEKVVMYSILQIRFWCRNYIFLGSIFTIRKID